MLSQNATTRNSLLQVSRVIAVLAKSACKHAIFLATRVNQKELLYHGLKFCDTITLLFM